MSTSPPFNRSAIARHLTRLATFLQQAVHDPAHVSLRRGLRAALVIPLLLASGIALGLGPSVATFVVFGGMALLVLADFGGQTRSRLLAYLTTTVVGVPLIVVGTLASGNIWAAVGATAVVGFGVAAVGVLGGYFLSAQTALLLAFVLAVSSVGSPDTLIPRVTGWCIAGAVATVAAWLLWPRSSHLALRANAATVVRALAAMGSGTDQHVTDRTLRQLESEARQGLAGVRSGFAVAQRRPTGATRRDRALAELATDLHRALEFATSALPTGANIVVPEAAALAAAVGRALQASAALLEGSRDTHDIEPLVAARDEYRAALDRWAAERLSAGASAELVFDGLAGAQPVLLMSYVALSIAQDTEVIAGLPPTGVDPDQIPRDVWSTVREELALSSIWLRNSLRTSLGLALAVLVARSLDVPFAFWVVLGTISALRSNASGTGRSAIQALAGTAVGVLIAIPFVGATGADPRVLWAVLPILIFLAAYTPAAVNFIVGQVSFSVLVVVLFNILAPTDWQIGVVRMEDAALGVGVSGVVGVLLWPRGARGQLGSALAAMYSAAATSLSGTFRRLLTADGEPADAARAARSRARTEAIRAAEVFELFLNERGRQVPSVDIWATLLSGGKRLLLIRDVLDAQADEGYTAFETGAAATAVGSFASDSVANIVRLAEEIRGGESLRVVPVHDGSIERRAAALASLAAPGVAASPDALRSAIGLVTTAEWLGLLDTLLERLEQPVAETRAAAQMAWWQ